MCAVFEFKGKISKPGQVVQGRAKEGWVEIPWAGFARNEILDWWLRKGAVELDVFASRFAERSDLSRKLIWDEMPEGKVVRGLLIPHPVQPLLKVVTRASTPEELARFEHPRMPLLESPRFGPVPTTLPPPSLRSAQSGPGKGDQTLFLFDI